MPIEGVAGAHFHELGVLLLLVSWLMLLHRHTAVAALTFAGAVLVKPLPLVLAPLYWRRIRLQDAVLAIAAAAAATI